MRAIRLLDAPDARIAWSLMLVAVLVLCTGGCGSDPDVSSDGASNSAEDEEAKKRDKPDLEFFALSTRPTDHSIVVPHIKPGHWIEASQQVVSNHKDFSGDLEVDPVPLQGVPFALGTSRKVVLAKSQVKSIPLTVYAPVGPNRPSFGFELHDAATGGTPLRSLNPMIRLAPHQFFFTVLTPEPDRFQFFRNLDSINPPTGLILPQGDEAHYRVMTPVLTDRVSLPSHLLTSTAVAYVLWDDIDPVVFTADQRTALIDWIHWGGQLILNGPETLDTLKNSFLSEYLPADGEGIAELPASQVDQAFNDAWTTGEAGLKLQEDWLVQRMVPRPDAHILMEIDDLPMVVERRVGRGRVVATAFSLAQRDLIVWPDFDGFFNAVILRREPRSFSDDGFDVMSVRWGKRASLHNEMQNPYDSYLETYDPEQNSRLRLFSRDTLPSETERTRYYDDRDRGNVALLGNGYSEFEQLKNASGVGGWPSSNGVSRLVVEALIAAAGIDVPRASFVAWMLLAYLVVLVPLNWAVFRGLGRVEWAWIAAPVITIVFALVVVKLAQLNIGFARAQTEIGIIEIQAGYDRAHISRYTAFYTSLGTNYVLEFDDPGALAQPLAFGEAMFQGQRLQNLQLRRSSVAELTGFSVASNSLGILHTEGMFDCEGGIQLRDLGAVWQVENKTGLTLQDVGIIAPGRFGWIAELAGNETVTVPYQTFSDRTREQIAQLREKAAMDQDMASAELDVRGLLHLAEVDAVDQGDTRLIAVHDGPLPGMTITPQSDQIRTTMVVVAHLDYKPLEEPAQDNVSRPQAEGESLGEDLSNATQVGPSIARMETSERGQNDSYTIAVDND